MTRESSPPDSPLSSAASTDHFDDDAHDFEDSPLRPPKRQKTDAGSAVSPAAAALAPADAEPEAIPGADPLEGMSDVSSDTSGGVPGEEWPVFIRPDDEDWQEQVSACEWDGCKAGDVGNMDRLVEHIHNTHIESRQKRYTCEWMTCPRKGLPHASGYALKAHMRSHTREKPFYCYLPECDRSFTRSDALAKHMRTVHETETLRPSDPIPKSGDTKGRSKLKIIIKTPQSHGNNDDTPEEMVDGEDPNKEFYTVLSKELFDADDLTYPVDKLYRKCYWESKWAKDVGEALEKECREWEEAYHREWEEKETLLSQVVESESDWHNRRQAILSGSAVVKVAPSTVEPSKEENEGAPDAEEGVAPAKDKVKAEGDVVNSIENGLRPREVTPA